MARPYKRKAAAQSDAPATDEKPSEAAIATAAAVTDTETKAADAGDAGGDAENTAADAAVQDAAGADALEAANAAQATDISQVAGADIAAADGIDTASTGADQDAPTAGPAIGFPLRALITNNTRMPVQVPALNLDLPASSEATITLYSEGDFKTLHSDLTALFSLNGFGEDAFTVSPAETTDA